MKKNRPRIRSSDIYWMMAALFVVLLQFWWLPGPPTNASDSYSAGAHGRLGLFRVLETLYPDVRRGDAELIPADQATLVMIAPDSYPDEFHQEEIRKFVAKGGTFVFAPNWKEPICMMPALGIDIRQRSHEMMDRVFEGMATFGDEDAEDEDLVTTPFGKIARDEYDQLIGETTDYMNPFEITIESSLIDGPLTFRTVSIIRESRQNRAIPLAENIATKRDWWLQRGELNEAISQVNAEGGNDKEVPEDRMPEAPLPAEADEGNPPDPPADAQKLSQPVQAIVAALQGMDDQDRGTAEIAAWKMGSGCIVVASSPDFFSNRAMLDTARAKLAVKVIDEGHSRIPLLPPQKDRPIIFDETMNAVAGYRSTGVLFSPALRAATLQLIALSLLFCWRGFRRFGAAKIDDHKRRRDQIESARTTGALNFRCASGHTAVNGFVSYVRNQLRRVYGGSVTLENPAAIAARTGLPEAEIAEKLAALQQMNRSGVSANLSAAQAASRIRWLAQLWRKLGSRST